MRRGFILVTLVLVSMSVACAPGIVGSVEPDASHKPTISTVENPKLVLGDRATTTEAGNTLTVLSYESHPLFRHSKPDRNFEFSTIEVEGCASPSSGRDLMVVGPDAFTLQLPDGTRVKPEVFATPDAKVKEPALRDMDPEPGTCDRGFVTFQIQRGERPELVIFEEQFVDQPDLAWKVPGQR